MVTIENNGELEATEGAKLPPLKELDFDPQELVRNDVGYASWQ